MSFLRPVIFGVLSLTAFACSTDHGTSGTADAAADAQHTAVAEAGRGAGGSPPSTDDGAGGGGGEDAGVWKFSGSPGLPTDAPWGPNILGLQNHADDSNDPSDTAFGLFWDPAVVTTAFVGGGCMAFGTAPGHSGGRDVGPVTVTGGADSGIVALTRDPHSGAYFLDGVSDPWSLGDPLSITAGSVHAGPLTVPTPFKSQSLTTLGSVTRGTAVTLDFSGSNAAKVALSVSVGNGVQTFLLVCLADTASGHLAIPGAAFSAFPAGVMSIDAKLSPVNLTQVGELAFFTAGESAEATIALR